MDIDLLSKMVKELILDNDEVTLPGVGTFVGEIVPSTFSDKGYTINPPYRKLSFRQRQSEDTLLRDFYMKSNNVDVLSAEKILEDFFGEMKEVLKQKKIIIFPGLGRLRATRENNFFFVADEDLDIYPQGYGLEPISLKTHQETPEQVNSAIANLKSILDTPVEVIDTPEPVPVPDTDPVTEIGPVDIEPVSQPEPVVEPEPVAEIEIPALDPETEAFVQSLNPDVPETIDESPIDVTVEDEPVQVDTPVEAPEVLSEPSVDPETDTDSAELEKKDDDAEVVETVEDVSEDVELEEPTSVAEEPEQLEEPVDELVTEAEPVAVVPEVEVSENEEASSAASEELIDKPAEVETADDETKEEKVETALAVTDEPKKRSALKVTLSILALLVVICAIALLLFIMLAHIAPDFVDSLLYTPEELKIINY